MDGRPDAAGSGVGGPVGGTLSSGLKQKDSRAVIGDVALCRVPSFGWDVKRVSSDSLWSLKITCHLS